MIDGGFSEWSQWSLCDNPCGGSVVNRTRTCTNPTPTPDGKPCKGDYLQTKLECIAPCKVGPVDGRWSDWSAWSRCPQACGISGGANIQRTRQCNNPPAMNGGEPCKGDAVEVVKSCFNPCPVTGGYTLWSSWTSCTKTCGTGMQKRSRDCTNPRPIHGGQNCTGDYVQTKSCKLKVCPGAVNGGWGAWSSWSTCTERTYCLKGLKHRSRVCNNPPPLNEGDDCMGLGEERLECPTPTDGCSVHIPNRPDQENAASDSFIALECETNVKYNAKGSHASKVPSAVYSLFDFIRAPLGNSWFGIKIEDDKVDPKKKYTKVCFEFVDPVYILTLVDNKASYYNKTLALPKWDTPGMYDFVTGISMTLDSSNLKKYEFQVGFSDEYVPENGFVLHDTRLTYYTEGNKQTFKAKGNYNNVPGVSFKTVVDKDVNTGSVHAVGKATSIRFHQILVLMGLPPSYIPDFFVKGLKNIGLWDFEMRPVEFARGLSKGGIFRFTSSIDANGVPVHVEILTGRKFNRIVFAVGFSFDRESFGKLAEKLSGIGVDFLDKLGLEFEIGLAFCPPGTQPLYVTSTTNFAKEPLHSQIVNQVPQGLFAGAQLVLPKDCKGSKFCEITKQIVGPTAKAYINGLFQWKNIKVAAGFANIHIGFGLYFHKLELYVQADWNDTTKHVKLGFRADIKIPINGEIYRDGIKAPSNDLFLFGVLEYDFLQQQVAGKLGFRGMWRKAFWINWLSLGNIYFGVTYQVGAPIPITGVQFGMRVEFGYDCLIPADFAVDGHCFGGAGYVGVGKPQFFHADITALTIGKIARMLGSTLKLPKPIDETGFRENTLVSYATEGVDLRIAGGPYIPEGFQLKGRVNIFGWEIYAHIKLSSSAILFDLKPDPVHIGSVAKIVRSPTDSKQGPWFYVDARKDPIYWDAYIEGYIEIFSISVYCRLNFTMSYLELLIQGNFLNLIKAEVYIEAKYGITFDFLLPQSFYVHVEVDLSGINKALDEAAAWVKGAFEAAQKKLSDARNHVIEKKAECKRKMSLKCDNCKRMQCARAERNCKGALDAAGKWIGGVINAAGKWIAGAVKTIGKALAPVGKFFKKVFKGWRRKRALQQKQNELFAVHIRRRRFISKLICEGIVGGGCKVVSYLCEGTCKAVEHIGKGLCNILDVAIGFLKGVEAACGWVSKAIQYVLTQLFRIHRIMFQFSLNAFDANKNTFAAGVDLTIFGKRMFLGLAFNLLDPIGSLKVGADAATSFYKNKMNPNGRTDTEKDYYDKPNPYSDFEMTEQFSIENQQAATDDRKGGCLFVDSKNENAAVKVTGCNSTDDRQVWSYTIKGQLSNVWSGHCIDTNGASAGNKLVQKKCDPRRDDQNFQCDLIVRTVKRRRANLCWQAAPVSLNGPGSLVHLGSLKCIHPYHGGHSVPEGDKLVIHDGCSEQRLEFKLDNGYLMHTPSGKCVRPTGSVVDGVLLGLYSSCNGHKFSFTKGGSLQHVGSRKCVIPKSAKMKPDNGEEMALSSRCENSVSDLSKEHLIFNFIPTNPYVTMQKCTDFGNPRLDQRFEVEDEPINTICTKFAKNLAHKKSAEQSSTAYNGHAERAVDENYSSSYDTKSCTHTENENNPWWRVDLGREHIITDVLIVNRYNNFERLKNFDVRVGIHQDQSLNPTCNDRVRTVGQGQALRVQCNPPIPGRHIAIQMIGKGILTLCEVSVYSRTAPLADLCQLDNGGCEQVCYNLCNLKVKCGCYPGFKMAYDGRTCIDIDECQVNNGGCDIFHGQCINTPGSHHCACRNGYQLKENSKYVCEDLNECNVANAGCEHICENTHGSFNCDCRQGYKLKAGGYGCENINECLVKNGGCEHTCKDYEGGYYCTCNPGYRLMDDDKSCEEIYCPALETPFRGSITPSLCTDQRENIRRNTMCAYGCRTGYNLAGGDGSLTCKLDGTWQGRTPYCKPVMCPVLSDLAQGGVMPRSCSMKDVEYGTRCVYYCNQGYELRGPRYTTCENTVWSQPAPVACVRVYNKPWISCPADIVVDLPATASTVTLGFKWKKPSTNMNQLTVLPSNLDENYPFPAGKTRVMWTATNPDGVSQSCFFYVIVNDVTPPSTTNCPASFTHKTAVALATVTWTEPTFTDNVGVVSVMASKRPGHQMYRDTSLKVQYIAADTSGNTETCTFTITVEGMVCVNLGQPKNGRANYMGVMMVSLMCNMGYYFNPKPPATADNGMALFNCIAGQWKRYVSPGNYAHLTYLPDCTEKSPMANGKCKDGSIPYTTYCLNCPRGAFHNKNTQKCEDCRVGTYQDTEGMTECQPCNNGFFTKSTRSKDATDCLPQCAKGYFSDNGLQETISPCSQCPPNTYQPLLGQTSCEFCPPGSKSAAGSTSLDDCMVPARIGETFPMSSLTAAYNSTIRLECFTDGRPAPQVTWTKVGDLQPDSSRVKSEILYDLDMRQIGLEYSIISAQSYDAGTYECKATNKLATASHRVQITVV
ncbi:uncharacterized protein LOC5507741 isoform X2 [Nematostella vectensis]|nr:uncharacterized protein LOC5507741 isoform X2 [Nematostella vectensis]